MTAMFVRACGDRPAVRNAPPAAKSHRQQELVGKIFTHGQPGGEVGADLFHHAVRDGLGPEAALAEAGENFGVRFRSDLPDEHETLSPRSDGCAMTSHAARPQRRRLSTCAKARSAAPGGTPARCATTRRPPSAPRARSSTGRIRSVGAMATSICPPPAG